MNTGNSEMCGKKHLFVGPGKYCQDCGHRPDDDCHVRCYIEKDLVDKINREMDRAISKWGAHDQIPDNLISAAVEELGEVAHAINHNEGFEKTQQEIIELIGVLVRLHEMVAGGWEAP